MPTPQDEAFLAAVRDSPGDDAPRLVYADWLEEHGHPERAEFIRVQCELARLPKGSARRRKLAARERELLAAHHKEWLPSLPGVRGEMRRGFVEHVTLSPEVFVRHAPALFGRFPIRSVSLHDIGGNLEWLGRLANSPHLGRVTSLSAPARPYDGVGLTDSGLEAVLSSPHARNLRELALPRNDITPDGLRRALRGAPRLTSLDLSNNPIHERGAEALAQAECLAGLTRLVLANTGLGPAGARALAESPHLKQLVYLDLSRSRILTEGVRALAESKNFTRLETLRLGRLSLKIRAAQALARSAGFPALRVLELGNNRLGDEGALALAQSPHLAGLRQLSLRRNRLSPAGVIAVAESPHLKELSSLDVSQNEIDARQREQLRARFGRRFGRF